MHNGKGTLLSLVLLVLVLTGCGNAVYKEAVEEGEEAVQRLEFRESLQYFKTAIAEKPEDERIINTILQTESLMEAMDYNREGKLTEAIAEFRVVLAFEKSLDGTIKVATDFLNILKKKNKTS